jgi:hypothetical protein
LERITEQANLFRRLAPDGHVHRDGVTVRIGAFLKRDPVTGENVPDPQLSVNLARLTTAEATRDSGGARFGVCQFLAEVPIRLGLTVRHDPLDDNYAHSLVEGLPPSDRGMCQELANAATIVIPPTPRAKA